MHQNFVLYAIHPDATHLGRPDQCASHLTRCVSLAVPTRRVVESSSRTASPERRPPPEFPCPWGGPAAGRGRCRGAATETGERSDLSLSSQRYLARPGSLLPAVSGQAGMTSWRRCWPAEAVYPWRRGQSRASSGPSPPGTGTGADD